MHIIIQAIHFHLSPGNTCVNCLYNCHLVDLGHADKVNGTFRLSDLAFQILDVR